MYLLENIGEVNIVQYGTFELKYFNYSNIQVLLRHQTKRLLTVLFHNLND